MDYEKLYKEALERAESMYEEGMMPERLEYLFPELAESEDEKIRKLLISGMKNLNYNAETFASIPIKDVIDWLERQREKKNTKHSFLQDAFDKSRRYTLDEKKEASEYSESILPTSIVYGESEEEYKLHTIMEAAFIAGQGKQKSTLTWGNIQELEEIINQVHNENPNGISAENFGVEVIERFMENTPNKKQKPAEWGEDEKIRKELIDMVNYIYADEERETLLTWLEKQGTSYTKRDVDDAYLKGISVAKNEIEKQYEADYQIRKDIATFIFNYGGDIKDRAKWMNYLGIKISFVEKQGEQKPAEWSEEDKSLIDNICVALKGYALHERRVDLDEHAERLEEMAKKLKSLRPQPKQEWTEEDELMLTSIIQALQLTNGAAQMKIDWLKSLKDGCLPQSKQKQWKPSEEQLEALNDACDGEDYNKAILYSLYKQLKTL